MRLLHRPLRLLVVTVLLMGSALTGAMFAQPTDAQSGDRITVTVDVYLFDPSLGNAAAYPQTYTYGQSGPSEFQALTPAANEGTVLAFREDGPIVGQADVGADGTATLDLPAGPFFISITGDTGSGSYVDAGTADTNWVIVINSAAGQGPAEPTAAPTVSGAEPTATTTTGTGENPANAEPTTTTGADTTNGNSDEASAGPNTNASANASTGASAAPGSAGTGSPAAIYAGDCDTTDFTADPVAVLSETTEPEGDVQGADGASVVETSVTTLALSLDDILAEDHVLVVFDEDYATVPLACGAIGGVVTEDGTLAFGLSAVDDSRYAGVATLSVNGDQTEAKVFLAEDLSPQPSPEI